MNALRCDASIGQAGIDPGQKQSRRSTQVRDCRDIELGKNKTKLRTDCCTSKTFHHDLGKNHAAFDSD